MRSTVKFSWLELSLEGEALTERMSKEPQMNSGKQKRKGAKPPEWADGLKRLYDSVLDEPLPDTFAQLLDKLDDPSNG
ncbi:MAG: NepR family anti-sigma factor [Novosphingobium sp.]|nr:NepR family anti-sigma factor [Novosphingobium sp.]